MASFIQANYEDIRSAVNAINSANTDYETALTALQNQLDDVLSSDNWLNAGSGQAINIADNLKMFGGKLYNNFSQIVDTMNSIVNTYESNLEGTNAQTLADTANATSTETTSSVNNWQV